MKYEVKFGKYNYNPKRVRWTVLGDVIADGVIPETGHRWFQFSNDVRIEVPTDGMLFEFSKERYRGIVEGSKKAKE